MSDQNPGTIKYKYKNRRINIGLIISVIIILYFAAYFFAFLFDNNNNNLYEVVKGNTDSVFEEQYTALALRSESVVNSAASGYINFFIGDKSSVYSGQQTYMIDQSGELSARLKAVTQSQAILTENDMSEINDSINEFRSGFNNDNYYSVYNFKNQIEARILDLINSSVFSSNDVSASSYNVYNSEYAGILVRYTDGFEYCTVESLSSNLFRKSSYSKNIIKNNDYVEQGSEIYKVITSEDWDLVIQITDPDKFDDVDVVTVKFLKDSVTVTGNFEITAKGGKYYGVISLNKDMVRYASDRYIQISFIDDTLAGLKVPKTSVTEKSYYVIPEEFLVDDSDGSTESFVKVSGDSFQEVYPTIVKQEDGYCYISIDEGLISTGDVIQKKDSSEKFTVGVTAPIKGVYIDSAGTPYFRYVNIIGENSDFYIVSMKTEGGIKLYDQVYIDYKDAEKK